MPENLFKYESEETEEPGCEIGSVSFVKLNFQNDLAKNNCLDYSDPNIAKIEYCDNNVNQIWSQNVIQDTELITI